MIARRSNNIFEIAEALSQGDPWAWGGIALVVGFIGFCIAYKKITGRDFVKSRSERREARRKRKVVLWEYRND